MTSHRTEDCSGGVVAKRFTDTDKWKSSWFYSLTNEERLLWIYILDECDHRGLWQANFIRASFDLRFEVTKESFLKAFSKKVIVVKDDEFFIPSFVEFQYGELQQNNNAHKPIIRLIEKIGAKEVLGSPSLGAQDKDKDKEYNIINSKNCESSRVKKSPQPKFDFESLYREYPRREGKAAGMKRLATMITTEEDFTLFATAVRNYAEKCRVEAIEPKFIKLWSSFIGTKDCESWRDYIEFKASPPSLLSPKSAVAKNMFAIVAKD